MKYCMIETAFDNKEEAEKTIKLLLEKKLVASCQMVESNSKWYWKKEYEESTKDCNYDGRRGLFRLEPRNPRGC